jgi:hypothetical protein
MIRTKLPPLREDMILIIKVARKLKRLERLRSLESEKSSFG